MLNAEAVHKRACRVLPEVLATSGVLLEDESPNGIAALLFPLRRKSNGAVAFHLSIETMDALRADPRNFLMAALEAREKLSRHGARSAYRPWRSVRMPDPGEAAYFTSRTDGRASIVVIPSERLAVYLWRD
ncbi:hypothetical protein [Pseudoxanthomonas yeongjuensis]|jgi:hypothetical protein|uniref:hypothetical protein n=1 Tax=Pseudoxanthomonas yeongjuensis TaxID=377616 RepID=UPI0013907890|nr:hypothetical protein [Pseudoxanthomonas yeongjuensis]